MVEPMLTPTKLSTSSAQNPLGADLEKFGKQDESPTFVLTTSEAKLLGIAGVGFFLDAYDLFIINPVATMLQYRLYGGGPLPAHLEGFVKAGANIGCVIGQFTFGYAADAVGRKAVYGKELMLIIIATILTLTTPTGTLSPDACLLYLGVFRIILGIGIGGDYPMSASIAAEHSNIRKRGTMLSYTFSSQGWGSFGGCLVTIIVLLCYKSAMEGRGETSKVDGVWRIIIGVSLIPAFGTLYQRLTLPDSPRFVSDQKLKHSDRVDEAIDKLNIVRTTEDVKAQKSAQFKTNGTQPGDGEAAVPTALMVKKAHFSEFIAYFSEWQHGKMLLGTCMSWFLLDIAFYGINLNQNVVLQQIGLDGKTGSPWNRLFKVSTGGMIITSLGFVPGYYVSILTIEKLGRKWIQIQGFLLAAILLGILASGFHTLSKPAFIVCFAFLQFFFNFGANTTTFCFPAEVFPTRFRATAHGLSAASGKTGAIISALVFNTLSSKFGTPFVLWIFVVCCIAGIFFTLLLPEVKGRDPDDVLAEETRVRREARRMRNIRKMDFLP